MSRKIVQLRVLWCLALAGCSGTSLEIVDDDGPVRVAPHQAVLHVVTGDDQEGVVASPLPRPLTVEVLDTLGTPVQGAQVVWRFGAGRGMVEGRTSEDSLVTSTDVDGRTSVVWQLGTRSGDQSAWAELRDPDSAPSLSTEPASAPGDDKGKKVGFRARGRSGEPAEIVLSHSELELTVGEEVEISAVVVDRYGNVVEGAEVTFTSSDESIVTVQQLGAPAVDGLSAPKVVRADPVPELGLDGTADGLAGQTTAAASFMDRVWDLIQ